MQRLFRLRKPLFLQLQELLRLQESLRMWLLRLPGSLRMWELLWLPELLQL